MLTIDRYKRDSDPVSRASRPWVAGGRSQVPGSNVLVHQDLHHPASAPLTLLSPYAVTMLALSSF